MDLISQMTLLGGVCDRATLVRIRGAREVEAALRAGVLVRDGRGRYALPTASPAVRTANALAGTLSHRSAAHYWGWAQKRPPRLPEVTFPRDRRVDRRLRDRVTPHWADLPPEDVEGSVTTPPRTLVDCMRNLPLDESLPIVDSALRADDIERRSLINLADCTRGRGRTRIREVAAAATGKAANPFESVLRAQALLVPGLEVQAQLRVPLPESAVVLHPDLGDPARKIALEAEGFEWHGDSAALTRDCRRYNTLSLLGWQVIRFSWVLVMHDPAYVHRTLLTAVRASPTCECRVSAA